MLWGGLTAPIRGQDILGLDQIYKNRYWILCAAFVLYFILGIRKNFWIQISYIILYPIILFLKLVFWVAKKHWPLVIVFSPLIYSFSRSGKKIAAMTLMAIMSLIIIFNYEELYLLAPAMILLFVHLVWLIQRSFRTAYRPDSIFTFLAEIFRSGLKFIEDVDFGKGGVSSNTSGTSNPTLASLYLMVSCVSFISQKIAHVASSRKMDIYLMSCFVFTVFWHVIVFSSIYCGLYKIMPEKFLGKATLGYLDCLMMTLPSMTGSGVSRLVADNGIPLIITHIQGIGNLTIVILLFFLLMTSVRDRYSKDIASVAEELESAKLKFQQRVELRAGCSLADTEIILLKENRMFAEMLLKLNYGADRLAQLPSYLKYVQDLADKKD